MYFCLTMLSYLALAFVLFVLYQLVFKVVLPVYRTTKRVRQSFQQMQERMGGQPKPASGAAPKPRPAGRPVGDYIDFEEVREK